MIIYIYVIIYVFWLVCSAVACLVAPSLPSRLHGNITANTDSHHFRGCSQGWIDIRLHKIFTEAGCDPDMRSMAEVPVKQMKSLVRLVRLFTLLRSLEPLGRKAQSCRTVCVSALKGDCCDSGAMMWDPCCLATMARQWSWWEDITCTPSEGLLWIPAPTYVIWRIRTCLNYCKDCQMIKERLWNTGLVCITDVSCTTSDPFHSWTMLNEWPFPKKHRWPKVTHDDPRWPMMTHGDRENLWFSDPNTAVCRIQRLCLRHQQEASWFLSLGADHQTMCRSV